MDSIKLLLKVLWAPDEAMFNVSQKPQAAVAPVLLLTLGSLMAGLVLFFRLRPLNFELPLVLLGALVPVVVILVVAGIYFGVFSLLGREAKFVTFLAVTAFAFIPAIFRSLSSIIILLASEPDAIRVETLGGISAALFLDPTQVSSIVYAAGGFLDVVSLWTLVLLVVGYKYVLRRDISIGVRTGGVLTVWVAYVGLTLALVGLVG